MDSEIVGLIDREVALLPRTRSRNREYRERLYQFWKQELSSKFPGHEEVEYIAKAVARKYRL